MSDEVLNTNLPQLSPDLVHSHILACRTLKNRVDLRLLEWLFVLIQKKFAPALGFPGPASYVMVNLHYEKSEAYCVVMVSKVLPFLPLTAKAYGRGDLSWSQVKQIARLRKAKESMKEEEWLAFARTHNVAALKGEVRNALKEGRESPRKGTYGLPNLRLRLSFDLDRETHELARKALEAKAEAMRGTRGDEDWRPTPEEVVMAIFEESLARELEGMKGEEGKKRRSIFEILYRVCPECRAGHIHTEDGLVEASPERLALIETVARKVEIGFDEELVRGVALSREEAERDIPEEVRAKVLALYGHACAHCGRSLVDLQIHHIIFYSEGGPHAVWNLLSACARCHGAVHAGTLEVYRDSLGELHWRSRADRLTKVLEPEIEELASIPAVAVVRVEAAPEAVAAAGPIVPTALAPGRERPAERVLGGLMTLGYSRREAQAMLWKARVDLRDLGRAPTENELFNSAVYGRAVVLGGSVRSGRAENGKNGAGKEPEARREGGDASPKDGTGGA